LYVADERDGFRRWLETRKVSPATVTIYLSGLVRFEAGHAEVDLRAVTRQDIEAHAAALRNAGLAPSTVHIWLRGLGRFFEYLVEAQRLLVSPMSGLRWKAPKILPGPSLTEKQADRLLSMPNTGFPQGIRDRAVLELCYATGLRRKEMCGLAVYDVDLDGGVVRVRHGKGDRERLVPLSREACKWLGEYLREIRPRAARRNSIVRALFLGRSGQGLTPGALDQILLKHSQMAGLRRVSCHALRRTVATALLRGGADVVSVSEVLGHANLKTTERYTRVVVADVRAVHARTHPRR
jgi:integrase/recombinase XerD